MTKLGKAVVVAGVISLGVIGGQHIYNYAKEVYDERNVSNVTTEKIDEINSFLNDSTNIGFLQVNYKSLDLSVLTFDEIFKLISNIYSFDDNGRLKKNNLSETKMYNSFKGRYITNLNSPKVCYNKEAVNAYLYSVTNQKLNSNSLELCTTNTDLIDFNVDVKITRVINYNDNFYNISYKVQDAENLLYIQKHNYENLKQDKIYKGTVVLEYKSNRYIFVSNNIKDKMDLENIAK
ncbi:MAG: hypothetical protein GX758_03140 [Tenericutes bacterium]|nr:hypothetical protein [Mycoplasmatota bacterium]